MKSESVSNLTAMRDVVGVGDYWRGTNNARDLPWRQAAIPIASGCRSHPPADVSARCWSTAAVPAALSDGAETGCGAESSVLAAWSGLGYYRRARMLHATAKTIVKKHHGNSHARSRTA